MIIDPSVTNTQTASKDQANQAATETPHAAPTPHATKAPIRAGVMGATGYAGAEICRILASHPNFQLTVATSDSEAGTHLVDHYPNLRGAFDQVILVPHDHPSLLDCQVVFMAVPHKAGMLHAPKLAAAGISVVDLSADFRFINASTYEAVYHVPHACPDLNNQAVYGQPETHKAQLKALAHKRSTGQSVVVGCAGCYVTACILAAAPALAAGMVNPDATIIADAISGVTGAGRKATATTHYCNADESVSPYGLPLHRHAPEIAEKYALLNPGCHESAAHLVFTPHLAPLKRGICATVYLPLDPSCQDASAESLHTLYVEAYQDDPLVTVLPEGVWPKTSSVAGTARAHVNITVNPQEGLAIAVCCIDNLGHGAAAQAVQCANILFDLAEDAGLGALAC